MHISKELLMKVKKGIIPDSEELKEAYEFFSELEESLDCLGPIYTLARNEIRQTKDVLAIYLKERGM